MRLTIQGLQRVNCCNSHLDRLCVLAQEHIIIIKMLYGGYNETCQTAARTELVTRPGLVRTVDLGSAPRLVHTMDLGSAPRLVVSTDSRNIKCSLRLQQ